MEMEEEEKKLAENLGDDQWDPLSKEDVRELNFEDRLVEKIEPHVMGE